LLCLGKHTVCVKLQPCCVPTGRAAATQSRQQKIDLVVCFQAPCMLPLPAAGSQHCADALVLQHLTTAVLFRSQLHCWLPASSGTITHLVLVPDVGVGRVVPPVHKHVWILIICSQPNRVRMRPYSFAAAPQTAVPHLLQPSLSSAGRQWPGAAHVQLPAHEGQVT
jgi:hypothetical protein